MEPASSSPPPSRLHRARRKALEQRTTINGLLRNYLELYVGDEVGDAAASRFLRRAQRTTAGSGAGGRSWTRDDLHERDSDPR
jgi:hypothetical protein